MENVFALTSMEKGVGRGWNGPRLQRGCVERGGPWRLLAAHQTCSPDRMVFVRAEAEEGGTIRMSGASSAPGKFGGERARTRAFIVSFPGGWGKSRRETRRGQPNFFSFRFRGEARFVSRIRLRRFERVYSRLNVWWTSSDLRIKDRIHFEWIEKRQFLRGFEEIGVFGLM